MSATNRQRKVLQFFKIPGWKEKSFEEASGIITQLFANRSSEKLYDRYVYFTQDFERDSDELKPFTEADLFAVKIPPGWDRRKEEKKANDQRIAEVVSKNGPFDIPPPVIEWEGSMFVLTGRFAFGSKKVCEEAISKKGGQVYSDVNSETDFLVVGEKGNAAFSEANSGYGEKVKAAITKRNEFGRPQIITEKHWRESLEL